MHTKAKWTQLALVHCLNSALQEAVGGECGRNTNDQGRKHFALKGPNKYIQRHFAVILEWQTLYIRLDSPGDPQSDSWREDYFSKLGLRVLRPDVRR